MTTASPEDSPQIVSAVSERLKVDKRVVTTGRVVIRKSVDERIEVVDEPVRFDEVEVRHVPINRILEGAAPRTREENGVLIVPVLEEVIVTEKKLLLKEELHVIRRQRELRRPQPVSVRSERVSVQRLDADEVSSERTSPIQPNQGELNMSRTVVAVYPDERDAQQVREELLAEGFDSEQVDVRFAAGADALDDTEQDRQSGGIADFFKSLFGGDDRNYADRYSNAMQAGSAVVTVYADSDDSIEQAQAVMNRHNPADVDSNDDVTTDEASERSFLTEEQTDEDPRSPDSGQDQSHIPVVEEELVVGTRVVMRGGVRVVTRVREAPAEVNVRLREERAVVERTPVDRPATATDLQAMREGSIEVRETAEEPVVTKEARVIEEVHVGKKASERTETIRDTVRHTRVEVENDGAADDVDDDYRRHWQSNAKGTDIRYEDYQPAYRYGSTLAGDQRYAGRNDWVDLESDVRRDWESRQPGTWDQMKDSVRYAWERVRNGRNG